MPNYKTPWFVENTLAALRAELAASPPGEWAKRYRRAIVVIETSLEAALARRREEPATDLLDTTVRSARSRQQLTAAASDISRRWGIVTSLQPEDFDHALRDARVDY